MTTKQDIQDLQDIQELGAEISQRLRWDGEEIVIAFRAALEEANLHTFNAAVGAVWEIERRLYETVEAKGLMEFKLNDKIRELNEFIEEGQ